MNRVFAPSAWVIALGLVLPSSAHAGKSPAYTVAPGTPVCTAETGQPVICGWTTGGLSPVPSKYAVEVIASYDPDCNDAPDLSVTFRFETSSADPMIEIPAAALDKTVCTSGDVPCTVPATYHAASVQARVKALNPLSRISQNNPFSGVSPAVVIPGVCTVACPAACVFAVNNWFADIFDSTVIGPYCSYDEARAAGSISVELYVHWTQALYGSYIANGRCSMNNQLWSSDTPLTNAEQAACATQFAPRFVFGPDCNVDPP